MDLQLRGKTALVTGSTAGIGYAIAELLAREGATVWVNGRGKARVEEAVRAIEKAAPGAGVRGAAADLGSAGGAAELEVAVPAVDLLINNLGVFEARPFLELRDPDWMRLFELNVMSGVRLCRAYLPEMLRRKFGRIVFISSESAVQIPAEMIHYGVTKTAQLALARGIAESIPASGVTVNSVLAGPTRSEGVTRFVEEVGARSGKPPSEVERDFFEKLRPSSLLKRFEEPAEIAPLVAYLCSPLASGTTGAALRVDGGVVRSIV